ncbi:MAG TPA: ABC transporter permease subunit [Candidatus Sulfotelmatobacter sp.]|nr:ABC transporter permease subunit [Candidatus Sulfotelmatobacter sp.]
MKSLWWSQIKAVIRLEFRKTLFARRGLWIYVLAALPVVLFIAYAIATGNQQLRTQKLARRSEKLLTYQDLASVKTGMTKQEVVTLLGKPPAADHWTEERPAESGPAVKIAHEDYHYSDGQNDLYISLADGKVQSLNLTGSYQPEKDPVLFAGVFQFFFLRLAVFFGCLGIFMNLFRGEVLDRSLHFYFLAPIRRDVLMLGKFLAGLLATCTIFVTSEVLQTCAFLWHFTASGQELYLYHNHGLENAFIYAGVTALACVGYGAFFLVAGMLFRNPIAPAAVALIWEGFNPFLPNILKQFSIIYYLKSLCPVDIPIDPGTPPLLALLISNPELVSAPLAILGLLIVACIALYISSLQVRRMEVNYTTE